MKTSEVLALIGAGYSKAEIEAMEAQDAIEVPAPAQAPEAPPVTEPEQAPAPAPAAPAQDNAELLDAIRTLTNTIHRTNIINSTQPETVAPESAIEKADKLLTNFLNT